MFNLQDDIPSYKIVKVYNADAEIAEIFKANGGKLNRKKRGGFTY